MRQLIHFGFLYYGFYFYLGIELLAYYLIKKYRSRNKENADSFGKLIYTFLTLFIFILTSICISQPVLAKLEFPGIITFVISLFICLSLSIFMAFLYQLFLSNYKNFSKTLKYAILSASCMLCNATYQGVVFLFFQSF